MIQPRSSCQVISGRSRKKVRNCSRGFVSASVFIASEAERQHLRDELLAASNHALLYRIQFTGGIDDTVARAVPVHWMSDSAVMQRSPSLRALLTKVLTG